MNNLKSLAEHYLQAMCEHRPKLVASSQRLQEPITNCDVIRDMELVNKKVGAIFNYYSNLLINYLMAGGH